MADTAMTNASESSTRRCHSNPGTDRRRPVLGGVSRAALLLLGLLAFMLPWASSEMALDGFFSAHQTAPQHVKDKVAVLLKKGNGWDKKLILKSD